MRYVTYSHSGDEERFGVLVHETVVDVERFIGPSWPGRCPTSLQELIEEGPVSWKQMVELFSSDPARLRVTGQPLETVRLHAPIPRPRRNIFCVGRNYGDASGTPRPMFFTKATTSVAGPRDDIGWDPRLTTQVDWEVELGAVVGSQGKNLSRTEAEAVIFGYTVINDLSARDLQAAHGQFFKGKSLDGFCPMGPCVVTADEFGNPLTKRISLRVNGVTKQNACTGEMRLSPWELLASVSEGLTLQPGDIMATGSPAGSGQWRLPQEWLQDGDVIEAEVEGIGLLRNQVVIR